MRFGSLNNALLAGSTPATLADGTLTERAPKVGEGATILLWSDRHAGTVVEVAVHGRGARARTRVTVQEDRVTAWSEGGYGQTFAPNPDGARWTFEQRPNGAWAEVGTRGRGAGMQPGRRDAYHDRSH